MSFRRYAALRVVRVERVCYGSIDFNVRTQQSRVYVNGRFLGIADEEDLSHVRELLLQIAAENPLVLEEPTPLILMQGFEKSGISVQFSVRAKRENSRRSRIAYWKR